MSFTPLPVAFLPGVNPTPDETEQNTRHIIGGNNIRFYRGQVEKIGGHSKEQVMFYDLQENSLSQTDYAGVPRTILSFERDNKLWTIIATNEKLYAKLGSNAKNITPLQTTAEATLTSDPLSFTNTDATMTVTYVDHGRSPGDRIKLTGATDAAGITAATSINIEHIVATVVDADNFTVELGANATSTASGGGSSIEIFYEIAAGGEDAVSATGYGIGTYNSGVYNASQTDTSLVVQPRIWWMDTYGDNWVGGPGQQGKCYQWLGDVDTAPTIISNAPDADWGWVEDARLVILSGNTVANSDTGDITDWTPGAASSAYSDDKEDANSLISRAYAGGENLIFADENKVFRLRWIGGDAKWLWEEVQAPIGIAGPHAHASLGNLVYIFGRDDVWYYNGGIINPLPNNTLKKYIFDDFNLGQRYKAFLWYNKNYNELRGHYPSGASNENDREFIFNLSEAHWTPRSGIARTASDRAGQVFDYPILASPSDGTYQHEIGYDDDGAAMNAYYQVAYAAANNGKNLTEISGVELDMELTGNATVELYGKDRPRNDGAVLKSWPITESSDVLWTEKETRWRSWVFTSNEIGGFFRSGGMREFARKGGEF